MSLRILFRDYHTNKVHHRQYLAILKTPLNGYYNLIHLKTFKM